MKQWNGEGLCSDPKALIYVIDQMNEIQRKTGNKPIVIHGRCYTNTLCLDYQQLEPLGLELCLTCHSRETARRLLYCACVTTNVWCQYGVLMPVYSIATAILVRLPCSSRMVYTHKWSDTQVLIGMYKPV